MTEAAPTPRDFTYIRPRKRRLSEYEAVTCYTQPDPEVFDKQGWYLRTAEGRPAWVRTSTRLEHPHWFEFRDPAALWQRPYVRMQAEQERSIARATEDAAKVGSFADFDPVWTREILGGHYRVWSFFEYGLFRCFAQAQREALSDTLGNVFCFEGVDRMRHAQAIVLYMMDLEENVSGFRDSGAKERWVGDPIYQPARRMTEELMALEDWAELAVAVNLVVDPIFSGVGLGGLVRRPAPLHGDAVTLALVHGAERDQRRNLAWTEELVRMATDAAVPAAARNREIVREWVERWTAPAVGAAEALAPVYDRLPHPPSSLDAVLAKAREAQAAALEPLGLGAPA